MIAFGKEIVVLGALKNQKEPPTGGIGGRELNNYEMGRGLWSGWSGRCIAHTYHKGLFQPSTGSIIPVFFHWNTAYV